MAQIPPLRADSVFLNIPYDRKFRTLYIAYVVGVMSLGCTPRVTLGISGGTRRLDKIISEIQSCSFSIHDLSRVELDRNVPFCTPRFNMPFELGLTVALSKLTPQTHTWFVFESKPFRLQKSLSDLNGTDPHIHNGTVHGVMRELSNAFVRTHQRLTVPQMMRAYRLVSAQQNEIVRESGAGSLFEASSFQSLCFSARLALDRVRS